MSLRFLKFINYLKVLIFDIWLLLTFITIFLAPVFFARSYTARFDYHQLLIPFMTCTVLALAATATLPAVLAAFRRSPDRSRLSARLLAVSYAVVALVLAFILAGSFISNLAWGSPLTFPLVLAFIGKPGQVISFLPLSGGAKGLTLTVILCALAALALLILAIAAQCALRLTTRTTHWIFASPGHEVRRLRRVRNVVGGTAGASLALCSAMLFFAPLHLTGEPVLSFFGFPFLSELRERDDAKAWSLLEDEAVRNTYPKAPDFARKNVILLLSDSLRADHMGVYGYFRPTTPFLSKLVAEGSLHRVDLALSTCSDSYCGIASVLSGRPFHEISKYSFKLNSLLKMQGYQVRYLLSGDHRAWPYLLAFYGTEIDDFLDYHTAKERRGNVEDINDDRNILDSLQAMAPYDGQPTFLFMFLMSSHVAGTRFSALAPFQPSELEPQRLLSYWNELSGSKRKDGVSKKDTSSPQAPELQAIVNRYDNGVLQADAMIAKIFEILDQKGFLKDSIVVISADHGDGLDEHGHLGHTRYLYQEDIHVPLLIYDPSGTYRNLDYATHMDIAPTIIARLGLPVPQSWRGRSLLDPPADRITLHQTRRGRSPCFAAVDVQGTSVTKYIRCGTPAEVQEEVYDLTADPKESQNLIATVPHPTLARLRATVDSSQPRAFRPGCTGLECRD